MKSKKKKNEKVNTIPWDLTTRPKSYGQILITMTDCSRFGNHVVKPASVNPNVVFESSVGFITRTRVCVL